MKILILNYEFPPLGGGAANACYYLLKEFSKFKNFKFFLITSSINVFREERFSDNVRIIYLDINKKGNLHHQSFLNLIRYSYKAFFYSKKLNKKEKFDLVHAFFGVPSGFIAMLLKLPYIVSLRGSDVPFYNKRFYWLDLLFFKKLSKIIWRRAKKVLANSEDLRELALKTNNEQRIEVIKNGVDVDDYRPNKNREDVFTIISTSRLTKRKGIDYLIKGFLEFNKKYKKAQLIIIGDGPERDSLKVLANINENIKFKGFLGKDQIKEEYQKAHVFVLSSFNEGMSNSLLEAMASGLAIISTPTGGARELVSKENGFVVNPGNSLDISLAFEKLFLDKDKLKKLQKMSREIAKNEKWELVANDYIKIYKNI